MDETTVQKISLLTPNIGVVYSGMGPDSRVLIRKARKQAQAYYRLHHENIPVAQLVREVAAVMQEYTRAFAFLVLLSWLYCECLRCEGPATVAVRCGGMCADV